MAKKASTKSKGRAKLSLAPLTMDQAVDAMFQIKPKDVKRIVGKRKARKSR